MSFPQSELSFQSHKAKSASCCLFSLSLAPKKWKVPLKIAVILLDAVSIYYVAALLTFYRFSSERLQSWKLVSSFVFAEKLVWTLLRFPLSTVCHKWSWTVGSNSLIKYCFVTQTFTQSPLLQSLIGRKFNIEAGCSRSIPSASLIINCRQYWLQRHYCQYHQRRNAVLDKQDH